MEENEQFWVYLTLPTERGSEVLLSQCGSVQITDNDGKNKKYAHILYRMGL